jgi:hypothetical protein
MVQGLGFRVYGSGFMVQGLEFGVYLDWYRANCPLHFGVCLARPLGFIFLGVGLKG